jgi:sulfur-oxidizing protein SoxY
MQRPWKRFWTGTALCACVSLLALGAALPSYASDDDSEAAREARWKDIEKMIFGDRLAAPDESIVKLDAPYRAEDASLVPIAITLSTKAPIKGLYLVIDDNPSPVAAHYTFGPAAYPQTIKMRVRVNSYTNMHAVAELQDGKLVEAVKFVKAAGGCSAPMGMSDEEAMKGMGEMRLKFATDVEAGKPAEATLMVRHPNFNGMQMDPISRNYTPARYIKTITVNDGDKLVFALSADISLSTNPVIGFGLLPQPKGAVTVAVEDNKNAHWEQSFPVPLATN